MKAKPTATLRLPRSQASHRGQIDFPQQRAAAAAQGHDALDQPAVDLADAGKDGEEDQHRHQDEGERHFRGEADAEPDDEERRQHDPRHRIEQDHHRLEQFGDDRHQRRGDAERGADDEAEREPAQRGGEGRFEMRPDRAVGKELDERGADRRMAPARRAG